MSEKKITSEDIKAKVDEARKECWDLIVDKFAMENMGEPWKTELINEMIGERP